MREPRESDFSIEVSSVGTFIFGRRTPRDALNIRRDYIAFVGGEGSDLDNDPDGSGYAAVIATIHNLCVKAPPGWEDVANLDLLAIPDAEERLMAVWDKLKETEDSFRRQAKS